MRLELLFLGKTKETYLAAGIEDFFKRLSHYLKVEIKTVKEGRIKKGEPENLLIERESETLMQNAEGPYLVCLDRTGKQMDSTELAAQMERWEMQGQKKITFVIGGPLGLSATILKKADLVLSLSPMTFTHDMTRLLLLEQLYRACTIKAGEKYHK
ncbi:MAG: 23S rRNA (pseudouridine(1915)-N(3))-methyltransferase RlmH [Desulfobacterales bacterium]|nr:23S rRNA (pseudouridine(1915)-N(3))-methyltransferase RlmH [Desulfobacterales bacterium]